MLNKNTPHVPEIREVVPQPSGDDLSAWHEVTAEKLRLGDWIVAHLVSSRENIISGEVVSMPERDEYMPGGWTGSILVQPPPEIYTYPDDDPFGRAASKRIAPTVVIPPRLFNTMLYRDMDVRIGDDMHGIDRYRFFVSPSSQQPNPET